MLCTSHSCILICDTQSSTPGQLRYRADCDRPPTCIACIEYDVDRGHDPRFKDQRGPRSTTLHCIAYHGALYEWESESWTETACIDTTKPSRHHKSQNEDAQLQAIIRSSSRRGYDCRLSFGLGPWFPSSKTSLTSSCKDHTAISIPSHRTSKRRPDVTTATHVLGLPLVLGQLLLHPGRLGLRGRAGPVL